MTKKIILTITVLLLSSLLACAGTNYDVCFSSLDADGDGTMSKSEFMVVFFEGDTAVFNAADTNMDGGVDHDEWEAYKQSQGMDG